MSISTSIKLMNPQISQFPSLRKLAISTFRECFFTQCAYTEANFAIHMDEEYNDTKFQGYLESADYDLMVAMDEAMPTAEQIVGFSLVGCPSKLPHPEVTANSAEIMKMYIAKDYRGKGVAGELMKSCLDWVDKRPAPKANIWIGVWSENFVAQTFYKKFGAVIKGEYKYKVGEDQYDDEFIMKIEK